MGSASPLPSVLTPGAATSANLLTWDPGLVQVVALHSQGAWVLRLGRGSYSPLKLCFVGPPTIPSSTFRQASFPISLPFSLPAAFSNPFSPSLGLFDQGLPLSSRYLCPVLSSSLPGVSSALPSLEPISCVVAGLSFPLRLLPSDPLPGVSLPSLKPCLFSPICSGLFP